MSMMLRSTGLPRSLSIGHEFCCRNRLFEGIKTNSQIQYTLDGCLVGRDEIIIHRLRIEHTFLTHGYLLKRDNPPQCSAIQTRLTVEHVLLRCPTWNAIHANHFTATSLLDLFSNVTSRCIVDLIKEIGFYRQI